MTRHTVKLDPQNKLGIIKTQSFVPAVLQRFEIYQNCTTSKLCKLTTRFKPELKTTLNCPLAAYPLLLCLGTAWSQTPLQMRDECQQPYLAASSSPPSSQRQQNPANTSKQGSLQHSKRHQAKAMTLLVRQEAGQGAREEHQLSLFQQECTNSNIKSEPNRGQKLVDRQVGVQAQPLQHTCMISAQSGPIICTPMTVSVLASTRIFMNPRPSLPEIVFFMGLQVRPQPDQTIITKGCSALSSHTVTQEEQTALL